jgi:hypothetical protein
MDIKEALGTLDTLNDDHWTQNGDVRIDAVEALIGQKVTRQEILNVAPHFNRKNVDLDEEVKETKLDEVFEELLSPREFAESMRGLSAEDLLAVKDMTLKLAEENQRMITELKEMATTLKIHTLLVDKAMNIVSPEVSNQTAIQQHLARQIEERQRRYADVASVKAFMREHKLITLDPRSVIDRAMARKHSRGANRPKR